MFQGTFDGASVQPREFVKEALKQNSAAAILSHPRRLGSHPYEDLVVALRG
jgi:DNA repair protein RadC